MSFTEQQVVEITLVPAKRLRAWVRRGLLRPQAVEGSPVFAEIDIARAQLLRDLSDDLELPEESVEVVVSLLDQVHSLRVELKALARAIEAQPEDVRIEVARIHREIVLGLFR
jgi:chaperone modulatory protein CbpM